MVDLGPCRTSTPAVWEVAIAGVANKGMVVYTNGSRDLEGRVGGGWHADGKGAGSIAVGLVAMVWDGKVAGIRQALRLAPDVNLLVLSDSRAAVLGMCKSAVFYHTPATIIVYYFPYITCLLYLLFLIKHVRTSG